jgi:hypothetical protein
MQQVMDVLNAPGSKAMQLVRKHGEGKGKDLVDPILPYITLY